MMLHAGIGERIRERREAMGLSLRQLAAMMPDRLGRVTYGTLGKVEAGTSVSVWVLVAVCEALDCTLDDLVPE